MWHLPCSWLCKRRVIDSPSVGRLSQGAWRQTLGKLKRWGRRLPEAGYSFQRNPRGTVWVRVRKPATTREVSGRTGGRGHGGLAAGPCVGAGGVVGSCVGEAAGGRWQPAVAGALP